MTFISLFLAASAQALPQATALPPPDMDAAAVLAPINAAFTAFEAGDGVAVMRQVYPDGRVTAVGTTARGSGVRQQSWTQFAQGLKPGKGFQERISDPAIDIDGDIAMVWALHSWSASTARSAIAATTISISSARTELGRS